MRTDLTGTPTLARRRTTPRLFAATAVVAATALALAVPTLASAEVSSAKATAKSKPAAATRLLGTPRSGLTWHSGAFMGGRSSIADLNSFGAWRGRPVDVATTYSPGDSYQSMMGDPWSINVWKGFPGRLNYGLKILPASGEGSLSSIGAGQQDQVWRTLARHMKTAGHGNAIVRVGWESNLRDWRWQATSANAGEYKAAFRRVVTTMRAEAPGLLFEFGIGCGTGLSGSSDRLAPLTEVYPGDDVVDLVGCDIYDFWSTHATDDASLSKLLTPAHGPGMKDVADFARAHGKGASYAEWGLARNSNGGGGDDNPYFISAMHNFFAKNSDVVAFECYFDEPAGYISSSLFGTGQNPRSSARYAELW